MASKERIGFIGLGNMGAPMARRLVNAGYSLVVTDAIPEAVAKFAAGSKCERAESLAALGEQCQVVITMLPNGYIVRDVLLGAHTGAHHGSAGIATEGVTSRLARGSVCIDMSSSSPVGTRELSADLAKLGFPLVDAPVSGGVKKAADGSLALMVGGEAEPIARVKPILEVMGKFFATGASGTGHAMKALNNFMSAANLATAAEAVIAGQRFGLDPAVMISILNASTGRNTGTDSKFPNNVLPRTFDSGFALGLMAKDLRLALEVARSTGAPAGLLEMTAHMWASAEQMFGGKADNTEVVRYLEAQVPGGPSGLGSPSASSSGLGSSGKPGA